MMERDYSLVGKESRSAVEAGLADATWYQSPVSRERMRELLERRDGPAIRDTLLWLGLIAGSGYAFYALWGSWWAAIPYFIYATLYATTSDSRWHESSHGTPFKTDWMNNALYELASFMVVRQSVPWRWSHTRHHSDTIIRGRDPEIAYPRPIDLRASFLQIFGITGARNELKKMIRHAGGSIDPEVAQYVPDSEYGKVFLRARIYLLIYALVMGSALYFHTILPLMFVGIPTLVGTWLMLVYGTTQHAGLAENVLDHRLNCRTVYMHPINRWLYWNMNYHVEHHMFPMVPYYNLPKLHALVKDDCPPAYSSIRNAFAEIFPAIIRQIKEPDYFVERELPTPFTAADKHIHIFMAASADIRSDGFVKVCSVEALPAGEVVRFDFEHHTYAVYQTDQNKFYATDGICTHGNMHLAEGFVVGNQVECAKHNGRFDITDGSVQRPPVCVGLKTHEVKLEQGDVLVKPGAEGEHGCKYDARTFKVVSNENVATFIKELVLEPTGDETFSFQPGEYLQLDIPAYEAMFADMNVGMNYRQAWADQNIFQLHVANDLEVRRNYSMANPPDKSGRICFNVRLSTPPLGVICNPGVGSSYVFGLKAGDEVTAIGPFGDFHIKDSEREMVYIGGGAGMAPLRSHIAHLFETKRTNRKVSYWYGARSAKELFYSDYFETLASNHENFSFHRALSEPLESDNWKSHSGFIHQVLNDKYLSTHPDPSNVEYYLCGPPVMVDACQTMLAEYGVDASRISCDEF